MLMQMQIIAAKNYKLTIPKSSGTYFNLGQSLGRVTEAETRSTSTDRQRDQL